HAAIDSHMPVDRKPALQARVDSMERQADEIVPGDNRPVGTQASTATRSDVAQIGAVARAVAQTGTIEIQAAYLEAVPQLPDAVEHRAVALIGEREAVLAAKIRRDREADIWRSHCIPQG